MKISKDIDMVTILGPTATGKTRVAAELAYRITGEIISADSRQVYREMNIGTGKDYQDYIVQNRAIPCHLIDIAEAGTEFNIYQYQNAFIAAYQKIRAQGNMPILCGGTGMYLEAVLKGYKLVQVPINLPLRKELEQKPAEELIAILSTMRKLHNVTDTGDMDRLIRAIEIEYHYKNYPVDYHEFPKINSLIVGIHVERNTLRQKITQRLKRRLELGMVEEVNALLDRGISPERLKSYGLEYKFITQYLSGELNCDEMFTLLNTAIHQFAKRQMTWFRRMEKNGFKIHWMDGSSGVDNIVSEILNV